MLQVIARGALRAENHAFDALPGSAAVGNGGREGIDARTPPGDADPRWSLRATRPSVSS
jgi:hypothetical protein